MTTTDPLRDSVAAAERERDEERRKRDEEFAAFESAIAREREVRRGLVEALKESDMRLAILLERGDLRQGEPDESIHEGWLKRIRAALAAAAEIDREPRG